MRLLFTGIWRAVACALALPLRRKRLRLAFWPITWRLPTLSLMAERALRKVWNGEDAATEAYESAYSVAERYCVHLPRASSV